MSAFRASLAARAAFRASPRASLRATPSAGFLKPAFQPHFGNTLYVFFFSLTLAMLSTRSSMCLARSMNRS